MIYESNIYGSVTFFMCDENSDIDIFVKANEHFFE